MIAYISGPMTGIPEFNYPAFIEAAKELRKRGHGVISPVEVCADMPKDSTWLEYMKADIRAMLDADIVVLLKGWEHSRGAVIEEALAKSLGIETISYSTFLKL